MTAKKKADKKPKKSQAKKSKEIDDQIEVLTNDLKRVQADFINYKRRSEEEKVQAINYGKIVAITGILNVLDSLERALENAPDSKFAEGIENVHKQFIKSLNALGVERIKTENAEFDPEIMEAVSTDDSEGESNVVVEELQSGYLINKQLIRPAMVKVRN